LIKGLQQGAVDLITCASFKYADYIPEFIVLDLPFLFFSTEHLSANLNGELGQILTTKAQESRGEHVLGYITDGPVNIVSDRALVYISQGKKLHFRTMLLPTHRQTWAKLGITPVTLASSEIKIGVEVGMVDAIETNYLDYKELRLYGTARFILQSEHYFPLSLLLLSKSAWYRIPASYRELVRQCAFDAIQYGSMKLIQQNKEVARELTGKYGVKITELNLAEKKTNRQKLLTYQEDLFNAHGLAKAWSELSKSYVEYETALAEELERIIQNQGE
jgi:TRAP-type C4-dicarboxylate transport system substrate-binding protein